MPQKHTKSNLYIEKTTTYDVLCKLGLLEFCLKPDRLLAIEILLNSKEDGEGHAYSNWKTPAYIEEGLKWLRGDFDD